MRSILLTLILAFTILTSNGQIIDNYGIGLGFGVSNQNWEYENNFGNLSGWKGDKIGFSSVLFIEKNLSKLFTVRPSIGYKQKGYIEEIGLTDTQGDLIKYTDNKVVFHDMSIDLSLKINPLEIKYKPYFLLGLRADYLIDYKSAIIDLEGEDREIDSDLFDDFEKMTFGGVIGIGINNENLAFVEIEYNPSLTSNYDNGFLSIKDRYFNLILGININELLSK